MITIAHILGSLGVGGAERVALDLAILQKQLGHTVLVVSITDDEDGPLAPEFRAAGLPVHHIPKRPGLDGTLPPRLGQLFFREGVDVVHTHNTPPLIYAGPVSRMLRRVLIHTKHGEGHMISSGGKRLRQAASAFVHSFVAVSETTAEHARAQHDCLRPSRIRVIRNGIRLERNCPDPEARAAVRKKLKIPQDAWVVGTVGRVDDNKNQGALIRALDQQLGPKTHLIVVGDGPSMNKLKDVAASSSAPKSVHLLGHCSDAYRQLAAFDVFALPSLSEGLPLVIPEAMATALPVVATSVGGIPKVILDGKTGFLVPAGDEKSMGARLAELAADPARAKKLGEEGRRCALAEYSAVKMTEQYLALYRQALA